MKHHPLTIAGKEDELEHLARTYRVDDLIVSIRCHAIASPNGLRFEVLMWADGSRAILDVPGCDEDLLDQRISDAAEAFVNSVKLRENTR